MKKFNSNMSIKEIVNVTNFLIPSSSAFTLFCNDPKKANEIISEYKSRERNGQETIAFLEAYEEFIDKEKFVLVMAYNYKVNLKFVDERVEELKKELKSGNKNVLEEFQKVTMESEREKKLYKDTLEFGRNIDKVISFYTYSEENKLYDIGVIDSKEVFQNKKVNKRRNNTRFKEIGETYKKYDESHTHGIEYVIRPLILTDLCTAFREEGFGNNIISLVEDNAFIKKGLMNRDEIHKLKNSDEEEYTRMVDELDLDELLPDIIEAISNYTEYLDMDKLLLLAGFRYNEMLKNIDGDKEQEFYDTLESIIRITKNNIKNKDVQINDVLKFKVGENDNDKYEKKLVNYTYEDLKKCLERFIDDRYVSEEEENELKQKLLNKEITIGEITPEIVNLMNLNEEEIRSFMNHSIDNFVYGIKMLRYSIKQTRDALKGNEKFSFDDVIEFLYEVEEVNKEDLIDLCARKYIKPEFFKKFSEEIDISSEINLKEINKKYLEIKGQKKPKEEDIQELDTVINIYKAVNLNTDNQEEKEELSNEVMYELAEDFEDEEDILFYYNKGLITLGTLAEWSGEQFIENLYNEGKITDEELKDLFKQGKISNKLIEQNFLQEDMPYEQLMNLISQGGLSENKITDLYMKGRIFDVDFEEMLNARLISHEKYFNAVESRTKEKLEENSKIILSPDLINIPNKKDISFNIIEENEEDIKDDWPDDSKGKRKLLIDPSIRYELFEKLGALKANPIELDPSNSFYNYEFFVIPNAEGKLDLDSVVIAERFYEDKEIQNKFAFDNATYFFQYKDLMVNSNLSKKEMTEERDKIIFRANHRSGNWAVSVLQKLAQTMSSTKFEECKNESQKDDRAEKVLKQLHKILSPKQIDEVLKMAGQIDDEERYTYELINDSYTAKDTGDVSDGSEER